MYTPRNFATQELVPPEVYAVRGEAALELLDPRALMTLDALRDRFGPTIVNTWHSQKLVKAYGHRTQSGLRTDSSVGAQFSQHRFGRAFDCLFADYTAADVRAYVRSNTDEFPYITALEDGISWFHFDVRNCTPIKVFTP